jgi:hypothetical protein
MNETGYKGRDQPLERRKRSPKSKKIPATKILAANL